MAWDREDQCGGLAAIVVRTVFIALVVAYPLSAGPSNLAFRNGFLSNDYAPYSRASYDPLIW